MTNAWVTLMPKSRWSTILVTGLFAGTLDILCAIYLLAHGNAGGVFRSIAKAAIGDTALTGGFGMIVLGAVFHFTIALSFTAGFFLVYPRIRSLLSRHPVVVGLLYGIFVWSVMNFLVLPLTHNPPRPLSPSVWKGIVILMLAVGVPISVAASAFYSRAHTARNPLVGARDDGPV